MKINELKANTGNIDLTVEVVSKDAPRTFEKFGKQGKVCNAKVRDDSGEVTLTLWNDDIDTVTVGTQIKVEKGWCSEFKGEKQVSAGKFGKITVVGAVPVSAQSSAPAEKPAPKKAPVKEKAVLKNFSDEDLVEDSNPAVVEEEDVEW